MQVASQDSISDIIPGVFAAITGGVFIYCTFFEILADEISTETPLSCIVAIGLGYAMMALILLIPSGEGGEDLGAGLHTE